MSTFRFAVIEPTGDLRVVATDRTVPAMMRGLQAAVGGYIESVPVSTELAAYVDEDGWAKGREPNPVAAAVLRILGASGYGWPGGILFGPVVIVAHRGPEEISLAPDQLGHIMTVVSAAVGLRDA